MFKNKLIFTMMLATLISCADLEFDSPLDPKANSYNSGVGGSSSDGASSGAKSEAGSSSSSAPAPLAWCVYVAQGMCFQGAYAECPGGGIIYTECPFGSSSSEGGSSFPGIEELPRYDYCVFGAERECIRDPGNIAACPPGAAPGNSCPYSSSAGMQSSSSSAVPSSSSIVPSSSSAIPSSSSNPPSSSSVATSSSSSNNGTMCGSISYNPSTEFCYNNSKVGQYCGNRKAELDKYNPDVYQCKGEINYNGIYLTEKPYIGTTSYEAVLIGSQVWMAEDLNYSATGSQSISGGRLYKLSDVLDKDVCPSGFHIPSDDEWTKLTAYVGGTSSNNNNDAGAGKSLKARNSWSNSDNGTDDYGFAALPKGYYNGSSVVGNGTSGYWWSSTIKDSAKNEYYIRSMRNDSENVTRAFAFYNSPYYSIRCVKDNN